MTQYQIGTVSVINGSAIVTGTSTAWVTFGIDTGDLFMVAGDNVAYAIASVDSETQITLSSIYAGVTDTAALYAISVDFTPTYNLPLPQAGDIEVAAILRNAFTTIDGFSFGGASELDGLTDVDLTGLNDNDILVYNLGTLKFEPEAQSIGSGLFNIVEDLTPVLGGNLDVNGKTITSVSGGDIIINPDTTGVVIIDGNEYPSTVGTDGQVLTTNGAGVATWANTNFTGFIEEEKTHLFKPSNKTVTITSKAKYGRTIDDVTVQTSVGSLTLTVKINSVAVTGINGVSVTTTETDYTATAANTIAAGDLVELIITAATVDAGDFTYTMQTTRL